MPDPLTSEERAELRRLYKPGYFTARLLDALDAVEGERDLLMTMVLTALDDEAVRATPLAVQQAIILLRQRLRESEGREAVLRGALEELRRIRNCGPSTPWTGCPNQGYDNLDHFDGHQEAQRKAIVDALATPTPPLWDLLTRLLNAIGQIDEGAQDGSVAVVQELAAEVKGAMGK